MLWTGFVKMKDTNLIDNLISVGIVAADRIEFVLNGSFMHDGKILSAGCHTAIICDGVILIDEERSGADITLTPLVSSDSFTLNDVVIGVGFHWERHEPQTFEGQLRLTIHGEKSTKGKISVVNILPVERYLVSVISSEMSATSSVELLKAHAVTSRSWLIHQLIAKRQHPSSADCHVLDTECEHIKWYDKDDHLTFDVCADDHCQRYQGITRASTSAVEEAVATTAGICVVSDDDGTVCDARFSKCCGGQTEIFSSCWEDKNFSYLLSFRDNDARKGHKHDFCDTKDIRILRQVLNSYDQETPDFYRWTVRYEAEYLSELVCRRSGIDFGVITDLVPVKRGPSGRIVKLKIVGSKCTLVVGKELEIRKWLSESHLYSSAFEVAQEVGDDGTKTFVLNGRGWGHGVGLCQIGAAVMADEGYSYTEILSHYFTNAHLQRIY